MFEYWLDQQSEIKLVLSVASYSCSSARHARRLHSAICVWRVPHWPVEPTAAAASACEQCGWQPSIEPVFGNAHWHERVCVSVPAPHVAEHCVAATQSVQTPAHETHSRRSPQQTLSPFSKRRRTAWGARARLVVCDVFGGVARGVARGTLAAARLRAAPARARRVSCARRAPLAPIGPTRRAVQHGHRASRPTRCSYGEFTAH